MRETKQDKTRTKQLYSLRLRATESHTLHYDVLVARRTSPSTPYSSSASYSLR
jgi:hypothetical protein